MNVFKRTINKIKQSRMLQLFLANTSWIIGERIFNMGLSMITSIVIARYLGPGNYGLLTYGTAIVTIFVSISGLGLESLVVRDVVETPEKKQEIMGTALIMRLAVGLISIFLSTVTVVILQPTNKTLIFITFLQSISIVFKAAEIFIYYFDSQLQSKKIVITQAIASFIVSAWKIGLVLTKAPVWMFALSITIEAFVSAFILFRLYGKNEGLKFKFSFVRMRAFLREGSHIIFASLMTTVYMQMDKIMIGSMMADDAAVGIYGVASALACMWYFVPDAICRSAKIIIMQAKSAGNQREYERRFKALCATIIYLGIAVGIIFSIFGESIVMLFYGKEYITAVSALNINIWAGVFAFLGNARAIWSVCENKVKYVSIVTLVGALVNLILNALLIPVMGIAGAAAGTLAAQFAVAIIAPAFFKELHPVLKLILESAVFKGIFPKRQAQKHDEKFE